MICFPPKKAARMQSWKRFRKFRCLNCIPLGTIHTGSYTLVTPKGKLYFAQLREMILLVS